MNDAMRGENYQPTALHWDESHHYEFVRRVRICAAALFPALISISERCFIAMMSVGNQELLIAHDFLDRLDECRILNAPDAMQCFIFVKNRGVWIFLGFRFQQRIDLCLG